MALADILNKIEADAAAEAKAISDSAERRASTIIAAATASAEEKRQTAVAEAEAETRREAARLLASAKLDARDGALRARHELLSEVLEQTKRALAEMGDADYASFLARHLAAVAQGGESVRMGSADSGRAEALREALRLVAPGMDLQFSAEPAPFERGVLLEGDRVRADLSLDAIVDEQRDDLELSAASVLFTEGA